MAGAVCVQPRHPAPNHQAPAYRADPDYGIGVAARLGLAVSDLPSAVAAE
jgi:hypothetical protein